MAFRLKFTHDPHNVHVQVPDLRPATIYARFSSEFPDALTPTSMTAAALTLRWLDSDGDWIEIRRDDKDFEQILLQVVNKNGMVHIQSGFTSGADEPTQLGTLMHRYERVMDSFDHLSRTVVKLPPISNILIVTKPDPKLSKLTKELSVWVLETFPGITLFVDKKLQGRSSFKYQEILDQNPSWNDRLQFWTKDCQACKEKQIHLAVTLGGDGTVLYTTWMFQKRVPPIVAFHLGSLGFLTNFCFDSYRPTLSNIIRGEGMNLNIRMRLQCSVYKYKEGPNIYSPLQQQPDQMLPINGLDVHSTNVAPMTTLTSSSATAGDSDDSDGDDEEELRRQRVESRQKAEILRRVKEMDSKRGTEVMDLGICHGKGQTLITRVPTPSTRPDGISGISIGVGEAGGEEVIRPTDTWQVLNEVTIDRGSNANMLQLELFVDGNHVTTILADGLVIATATGSTAYSLSIGGSLIHPDKNSVIISPIAPHSLTARPMIIPGTKHLRVCVPASSRTTAWASFDGRHRQELGKGDSIMITASRYPATTICRRDQSTDWFTGLTQVLNWNSRVLQKPLESHL
ncbi:ATP-NAD kinase [Linnemannia elongata AG-77]|uniref:ATP-NAD kinase n=1 Tax=Linnemannia elongata AG-77 TaxID=1314771 RepID=A0A197JHJ4_9FUNG|nr:ATP-NAD kinase [Linnemannia elongata AG-77]